MSKKPADWLARLADRTKRTLERLSEAVGQTSAAPGSNQTDPFRDQYRLLFHEAIEPMGLADAETGILLECNASFARMLGSPREELIGMPQRRFHPPSAQPEAVSETFARHRADASGRVLSTTMVTKSGREIDVDIKASLLEIGSQRLVYAFFRDMTPERRNDRDRRVTLALLDRLARPSDMQHCLDDVTTLLQQWSGCAAVGARLLPPYGDSLVSERGFRDSCGEISDVDQVLDLSASPEPPPPGACLCGAVLWEHAHQLPEWATPRGSVWTNDANRLFAHPVLRQEPGAPLRRCQVAGFRSLAVVPIRYGERLCGLIQLADPSPEVLDEALVTHLESLADQLAIALEQRRAQVLLQRSEEQYRIVVENQNDLVVRLDRDLRLRFVNQRYCEVFGQDHEALIGTSFQPLVHEEDREHVLASLRRLREPPYQSEHEERAMTPRGWRWFRWSARAEVDADGEITSIISVGNDITERRQAEQALRESESQLQSAQAVAHVGHYRYSITEDHWTNSPELDRIFGIDDDYPRNAETWLALVHPEDREMMQEHLVHHVIGEGHPFDRQYRIVSVDHGAVRWVHGLGELDKDAAGAPLLMFGTIQDITALKEAELERHQLEEELRQSQKMESIGRLAGGIAHDFNNLLAVIRCQTDLALNQAPPVSQIREDLDVVNEAVERAAELINQLLTFSHRRPLELATLDLNRIVRELVRLMQRVIGEDIHLDIQCAPRPAPSQVDPVLIQQTLMNLCVNARDAMPTGGSLSIRTAVESVPDEEVRARGLTAEGPFVVVRVSDTGAGIPPEVQARIWEPFFTTKEIGKGTGLGLASVYSITRQHGGWVEVDSGPDRGTTFSVFLPLSDAPLDDAERPHAAVHSEGRGTILLAEDDDALRRALRRLLERAGYTVLPAQDGRVAVKLARERAADLDLAVLDVKMPHKSGLEVYSELMALRPDLKVLFCSGYGLDEAQTRFLESEKRTLLHKPFPPSALINAVRETLEPPSPPRSGPK